MSPENTRQEEFRIDGEEIKDKVREAFQSHRTETREIHVSGDQLVAKVKEILHEGNIRRISIKNAQGTPIFDVPLTLGVAGALLLFAAHPDFNPGVVGLVASRLTEVYYRPAIVAHNGPDFTRASCRSIREFHITAALDECAELMVRHGGHAMAAGFTIEQKNFDTLKMRLQEIARVKLDNVDLRPVIRADLEMDIKGFNPAHFAMLEQLQPTGMGNPAPVFVSRKVDVEGMRLMGKEEDHISFFIRGSKINRAVAFNQAQWYETWKEEKPQFDIAYTIDVNHYNGLESLQLRVLDMKISGI